MNLDKLAYELHQTAVSKGFWDSLEKMPEEDHFIFYAKQIAMIHSEATEVLEALRKSKGHDQVVEELADIVIRVLDLYEGLREKGEVLFSLEKTVKQKAKVNEGRPKLHGVKG
jgi:NTP pyrophosphatase (non-canonical NTP hydrolase)